MGITIDFLSDLVETFYRTVQKEPELGPIFNEVIQDNWPTHMQRMKDFWASVTLNAGLYSGKPVPAHMKIEGLSKHHFEIWLNLFQRTLNETAPSEEAAAYIMLRANRIAQSLQLAVFPLKFD